MPRLFQPVAALNATQTYPYNSLKLYPNYESISTEPLDLTHAIEWGIVE